MALIQSQFTAVYDQVFSLMFRTVYQATGRLRNTCNVIPDVDGDAYKLKYMDSIEMEPYGTYGAPIPASPVTTTAPTITFSPYQKKTIIAELDQKNFKASALAPMAQSHADALGRREDQYVIDALDAGATKSIANGGTNMNVEKIIEAYKLLADDEVPGDMMYLVMGTSEYQSLMGETQYTSSIFNNAKPLVDTGVNLVGYKGQWGGFHLIVLGTRGTGGLPLAANIESCFAFAHSAVTMAYQYAPTTRMVPVEQDAFTAVLSLVSAGAVVGDARGVVKIDCDITA